MTPGVAQALLNALLTIEWVILLYFFLLSSFYGLLLMSAVLDIRPHLQKERGENRRRLLKSEIAPRITLLAPAYNEAKTIAESLRALLGIQYPNLEVIVINDGSKDETLGVLHDQFGLSAVHPIYRQQLHTKPVRALYRSTIHPNLVVVDKENGGKADSLNAGLNIAANELVCAIDADTLIEPDALQRMVRPFIESNEVVAAGGTVRPVNGALVKGGRVVTVHVPRRPMAGVQVVEYLRAFLFGRLGWNRLGGNMIISGAFGLFRREAVIHAGGYLHDTVGEDMELVVRLRRVGYEERQPQRVIFIPDPVAWTEVPESLDVLGNQRDRWHRGLADVLWRHRRLFFNPSYGALGLLVFPYFVFGELLAPVIEATGLIIMISITALGEMDPSFACLFFLVAYGYGILLSLAALTIEEFTFHRTATLMDRVWLVIWCLFENIGFRQFTVYWRLRGLIKYARGSRDWGAMTRRGFSNTGATVRLLLGLAAVPATVAAHEVSPAVVGTGAVSFQENVPMAVQEVDVIYVSGREPRLVLKAAADPPAPRRIRPSGSRVNILDHIVDVRSEPGCKILREPSTAVLTVRTVGPGDRPCPVLFAVAQTGTRLDLLSYQSLTLRGSVSAPISVTLADSRTNWRGIQSLLEQRPGRFDVTLPLMPGAKGIDLRDVTMVAVVPQHSDVVLQLDELSVATGQAAPKPHRRIGFWVWDYREATAQGSSLLDVCQSFQCSRLAVQMPALGDPEEIWLRYAGLLQAAQRQDIEAFALDGYPEAVLDARPLLKKVERLRKVMQGQLPAGVQLDIEPYLLDAFLNDARGYEKYLEAHAQVKRALGGQARLSIVMPFWLTSQTAHNRAVAFAAMDLADEVAIMSYRTDLAELRDLVEDQLRYADLIDLPVWLAVETQPLPLEEHVRLEHVTRRGLATAYLDRAGKRLVFAPPSGGDEQDWFRIVQRTTVRPERLTFSGRPRRDVDAMIQRLDQTLPNRSFSGVLIHDYPGFLALPAIKEDP
jgi:cellulose synthase/poly-beta-1,6-N-acetylglucosamine synthase-like glycosyltransferase